MKEVWKDIDGYEGYYKVSNLGRVKSIERKITYTNSNGITRQHPVKEMIIAQKTDKHGYQKVSLKKEKQRKLCGVHRLVAQAFIDNPDNLPLVNHKDEIRGNNNVLNLEWCTYKYNNNYGNARAKMAEAKRKYYAKRRAEKEALCCGLKL